MTDTVSSVALALSKIADVWLEMFRSTDKRKMQKAIQTGDKIVDRCRELAIDDKKLDKLLAKYGKYNN